MPFWISNVVVGLLGLLLWALFARQLKTGWAVQIGRGLGPETHYARHEDAFAYWLNQVVLLIGGGALLVVAFTQELI